MALVVDSKWLAANLDNSDIVILDTRGNMPYRFGHIKNALPLGLEMVVAVAQNGANLVIDSAGAEKVFGSYGIDGSKKVIVYGEPDDPTQARVAWSLLYHGHQNTAMLDIGFQGWKALGLPVSRDIAQARPTQFHSRPNAQVRADAEAIKVRMGSPSFVVVDARTAQEHMQARIPGSFLHNWEDGIGQAGTFMSGEDLKKEFESKGITADKEVVCYCHSGMRASHKYMQLRLAGYYKVELYDGSIIDWAMRKNPIR